VAALREHGVEKVEGAAVLGAGATASSALAALARICTGEVAVYVRSEARATEMRQWAERLDVDVRVVDWARAGEALRAPLVVATTPAGATDALAAAVPEMPATLFDVLYDPWPTALAARWSAHGGAVVSGLDLLVHQAVLQVEQMTGRSPAPLAAMRAAGERALADR
ncbi:shikimate dehydrogenase, partial [Streptomyces sp. TRM76130]|nr:shikimate dehydrogenase [Streptomyces sp. TRM76130]